MASKHYLDQIAPYGGRKYTIQDDYYGYKTITDVTQYQQEGTAFGAADVNETCVLMCDHSKSGTVHNLASPNTDATNLKFIATADFNKNDTFSFNGKPVSAVTPDNEFLEDKYFVANSVVSCYKVGSLLCFTSMNKGTKIVTLWENASPGSNFNGQTISIPKIRGYKYIIIRAALLKQSETSCTLIGTVGDYAYLSALSIAQPTWGWGGYSRLCKITTDGVEFRDGYKSYQIGSQPIQYAIGNDTLIPLTIMGVKL